MKPTLLLLFFCLAAVPASAQVSVEPWLRRGTLMLTAEVGGAAFSDFRQTQARPLLESTELGEFQRRVSARTAMTVGGSAAYWFGDSWGLRLAGAFVPTSFSVWNEEAAQRVLDERGDGERDRYSKLAIWMADVGLVFRFPHVFGRVAPYGLVGGSWLVYQVHGEDQLPPEAQEQFATGRWATPAALFGAGAVIPLQQRNTLLSFELTNHLTRTPLHDEDGGEQFELDGISLELQPRRHTGSDGVALTSNLRLTIGLTLPIR